MPVQGILTSDAAFSQAGFDALKQQVQQGTVNRTHALHEFTNSAWSFMPPPPTTSGPGGTPPRMFSPQATSDLIRAIQASGYQALRLADPFPAFTYRGHMLNGAFHELDPVFGGLKADFHI